MRIHWILLFTHASCAAASAALAAALFCWSAPPWAVGVGSGAVLLTIALTVAILVKRVQRAVRQVEHAARTGELLPGTRSGILELESVTQRVSQCAHRWEETVAGHREQVHQFQTLLDLLDRRAGRDAGVSQAPAVTQLRQLLAAVSASLDAGVRTVRDCCEDLSARTAEITADAQELGDSVSKTTAYVEQLSGNIDTISAHGGSAYSTALAQRAAARETLEHVVTLSQVIDRVRMQIEASRQRVHSVADRSHEIRALIENVSRIAARTDLLALNASLESIRAGEHGRGFAIVAEEVRKLAEQTSQASREALGLIEAVQAESKDTGQLLEQQQSFAGDEVTRAQQVEQSLGRMIEAADDVAHRAADTSNVARLQLQLVRDLVTAVERIANTAKAGRSRAEKARWTTKTLHDAARHLDDGLTSLRRCQSGPSRIAPSPLSRAEAAAAHKSDLPLSDAAAPAIFTGWDHSADASVPLVAGGAP